jgi:hypothetical protein
MVLPANSINPSQLTTKAQALHPQLFVNVHADGLFHDDYEGNSDHEDDSDDI